MSGMPDMRIDRELVVIQQTRRQMVA